MSKNHPRKLDAGCLEPTVTSFELHLRAENKSKKTIKTYTEAAQWFAGEQLGDVSQWAEVTPDHVRHWMVILLRRYSDSYASNQYRALQQFFRWWSAEEGLSNPMAGMKPPKIGDKVVPVFAEQELDKLLWSARSSRRDYAIIMLFKDTGVRLAELAGLDLDDVDLRQREALVTGKGDKQRTVKFGHETARSIDRYLRQERAGHKLAARPEMWLGTRNRDPLTAWGIYQVIKRRGKKADVEVYPHRFRHDFSHRWLEAGGAEGDLMELNGWTSAQMLRRYGRSAASSRARRSYDRVMGA